MYLTGVGESESSLTLTDTYAKVSAALSSASGKVVLRFSSVSASDTENCVYVTVEPAVYTESHVLYASGGKAYAYLLAGEEYVWTDVSAYVTVEEKVPEGAAYIQLTQFEGNAGNEFAEAARQYKEDGADTLLFDLRNNGGGRLSVMQQIARYLCKDASAGSTVLEARYRSGRKELYTIDASLCETYFAGSRIYAAGNGNTASASEALLGAMISYGTLGYGDIFVTQTAGEDSARTYGKGIMQTTFRNGATGEAIKLTTAEIYWPNGVSIHGKGITAADGAAAVQAGSCGEYGDPELSDIFSRIA